MPENQDDVLVFNWKDGSEVHGALKEFNGHYYADIRTFWQDTDGEFKPTKKGINLPMGQLKNLRTMVDALIVMAEKIDPNTFE